MKYILRAITSVSRPLSVSLALPRSAVGVPAIAIGAAKRFRISMVLVIIGAVAALSYVFAVNAILMGGAAILRTERTLAELDRETAILRSEAARLKSPSWVEARSQADGMVNVTAVRYLRQETSLVVVR